VTVKLICRHNPLSPIFEAKLSIITPTHINLPENRYHSTSRLYQSSMTNYTTSRIEDVNEVPKIICNSHKFDAVTFDLSGGDKQDIVKLTLGFKTKSATHERFFNTLLFTSYINRVTN
jgi:hypothetical protein